jgi:UDP-N-acetylglucosamine 2-epimerase (hydrolysing)
VSKLSHIHFVSNDEAAKRLLQMGEVASSIFYDRLSDIDIMFSNTLPNLEIAKAYYQVDFEKFAIVVSSSNYKQVKWNNIQMIL